MKAPSPKRSNEQALLRPLAQCAVGDQSSWRPNVPQDQLFKQGMERFYSARSQQYDHEGCFHPTMINHIFELAKLTEGQHVADLCCGTGQFAVLAVEAVGSTGQVTAVDFSRPMLNVLAEKQTCLAHGNLILQCADVESVEFPLESFDRIICASALVLLRDIPATLAKWRDWLTPGGHLVLDGPSDTAFRAGILLDSAAREVGIEWPVKQVLGSEPVARALLQSAGLVMVSFTQQHYGGLTTLDKLIKGWEMSLPFIEPVTPPHVMGTLKDLYMQQAIAFMDGKSDVWNDDTMNFVVAKRPV